MPQHREIVCGWQILPCQFDIDVECETQVKLSYIKDYSRYQTHVGNLRSTYYVDVGKTEDDEYEIIAIMRKIQAPRLLTFSSVKIEIRMWPNMAWQLTEHTSRYHTSAVGRGHYHITFTIQDGNEAESHWTYSQGYQHIVWYSQVADCDGRKTALSDMGVCMAEAFILRTCHSFTSHQYDQFVDRWGCNDVRVLFICCAAIWVRLCKASTDTMTAFRHFEFNGIWPRAGGYIRTNDVVESVLIHIIKEHHRPWVIFSSIEVPFKEIKHRWRSTFDTTIVNTMHSIDAETWCNMWAQHSRVSGTSDLLVTVIVSSTTG